MQKFATPAPITAVLDVAAGSVRFTVAAATATSAALDAATGHGRPDRPGPDPGVDRHGPGRRRRFPGAVTDTGGPGTPAVHPNGRFATQGYWRHVTAELGDGYRHLTYDERARGRRSARSADYSFEACVRDADAVLAARGVQRALVAGWSYGAFRPGHRPGRRRPALRLARRRHGATHPHAVPAVEPVPAAAAPHRPDPADERRGAGAVHHRARQPRPDTRPGPRTGRHRRPHALRGRLGDVPGQPRRRAGTHPRRPCGGGRPHPVHRDQREGPRHPRTGRQLDPAVQNRVCGQGAAGCACPHA